MLKLFSVLEVRTDESEMMKLTYTKFIPYLGKTKRESLFMLCSSEFYH